MHAVKALDLTVKPGEIVALLGSSGCGKTSTLRMIAGFEDVSNGTITLDGKAIHYAAAGAARRRHGLRGLFALSAADHRREHRLRAEGREAAGRRTAMRASRRWRRCWRFRRHPQQYPTSVSGGQQQRASLGRALVRKAGLYLLDEPMGQLEPQLRAVLRGRIKHYLREHKCTTILVTHDQTEANALADRIAVMEGGELQQYATPAELKARPANLFTGTFIGEPPMNVFDAAVTMPMRKTVNFALDGGTVLSYPASDLSDGGAQSPGEAHSMVAIGIRPHALHVGEGAIKGKVMSCQWLGDQTHVAVDVAGRTVVSVAHERVAAEAGHRYVAYRCRSAICISSIRRRGKAIAHGGDLA